MPTTLDATESTLLDLVNGVCAARDAWAAAADDSRFAAFEAAIETMLARVAPEFPVERIPDRFAGIYRTSQRLRRAWEKFVERREETRDTWDTIPPIVLSLCDELHELLVGYIIDPGSPRFPEPVGRLLSEGVSPRQIAQQIYGHDGSGPFLTQGVMREDLIQQEADSPGSIVPPGWLHPTERARLHDARKPMPNGLLVPPKPVEPPCSVTHPPAPETIEELLRQGVSVGQVARMKDVSVAVVIDAARKLSQVGEGNLARFVRPAVSNK